jgi:hypothetical protein
MLRLILGDVYLRRQRVRAGLNDALMTDMVIGHPCVPRSHPTLISFRDFLVGCFSSVEFLRVVLPFHTL